MGEGASGLDRESVANVSLIVAIDKAQLIERVGKVTARKLERVLGGSGCGAGAVRGV